ncbi:hypothetical protein M427DRAFT_71688 [Gonapodya prolifera JEL478]|uniref:Uncharacterized protein n=1 Tax=Gonapodya prolifera (strain JEL478) TaxID=1344416 RepID=A0A139A7Y5_GONPJ|nr:hypothetical protein M427DRAFT_71688 [Gonapodya prolifera JEL478]|eukprot:KXS12921.1 hypothetical protein M427DRAFT_71688 [Gonapodya prolifera JEL478]
MESNSNLCLFLVKEAFDEEVEAAGDRQGQGQAGGLAGERTAQHAVPQAVAPMVVQGGGLTARQAVGARPGAGFADWNEDVACTLQVVGCGRGRVSANPAFTSNTLPHSTLPRPSPSPSSRRSLPSSPQRARLPPVPPTTPRSTAPHASPVQMPTADDDARRKCEDIMPKIIAVETAHLCLVAGAWVSRNSNTNAPNDPGQENAKRAAKIAKLRREIRRLRTEKGVLWEHLDGVQAAQGGDESGGKDLVRLSN